jgi:glutathione reductase (NADPH)
LSVEGATFDTSVLLRNVRHEVDRLNALHIEFLAKAGVDLITGWGRFLDPHRIGVSRTREGEIDQVLQAKRVMISVGGRPFRPDVPGAELAWVSDDMFLQERFPDQVVVVGAGFIACEFAGILRGLGVGVTQLVRGEHLLRGFDSELAGVVQEGMQEKGIDLRFGQGLAAIEGKPNDLTVVTKSGDRLLCGGVLLATTVKSFGLPSIAASPCPKRRSMPFSCMPSCTTPASSLSKPRKRCSPRTNWVTPTPRPRRMPANSQAINPAPTTTT